MKRYHETLLKMNYILPLSGILSLYVSDVNVLLNSQCALEILLKAQVRVLDVLMITLIVEHMRGEREIILPDNMDMLYVIKGRRWYA